MRFADAVKERYTRGLANRYFVSTLNTYLAWPWTRLFVAAHMTPNQVSVLSFLISIAGMVLIAWPASQMAWLGAVFLLIGIWWDHSDGQVARITKNGSLGGGLLDTIFDRWVEVGWVVALGIGVALGAPMTFVYPEWLIIAATVAAAQGTLYVRWANIQKDLYLLQQALKIAHKASPAGTLQATIDDATPPKYDVRTFFIPFAFNRDVTLWLLAFITWSSFWVEGMLLFAGLHIARGLEMNWYTFQGLRKGDPAVLTRFLHPDYHK